MSKGNGRRIATSLFTYANVRKLRSNQARRKHQADLRLAGRRGVADVNWRMPRRRGFRKKDNGTSGKLSGLYFRSQSLRSVAAAIRHSAGYVGRRCTARSQLFPLRVRSSWLPISRERNFPAFLRTLTQRISEYPTGPAATAVSAWGKKRTDIEIQPRRQLDEALDQHWISMSSALAKRKIVPTHAASRLLETLSGMPEEWFLCADAGAVSSIQAGF